MNQEYRAFQGTTGSTFVFARSIPSAARMTPGMTAVEGEQGQRQEKSYDYPFLTAPAVNARSQFSNGG